MAHDCDDVTDSQCVHTVKVIFQESGFASPNQSESDTSKGNGYGVPYFEKFIQ